MAAWNGHADELLNLNIPPRSSSCEGEPSGLPPVVRLRFRLREPEIRLREVSGEYVLEPSLPRRSLFSQDKLDRMHPDPRAEIALPPSARFKPDRTQTRLARVAGLVLILSGPGLFLRLLVMLWETEPLLAVHVTVLGALLCAAIKFGIEEGEASPFKFAYRGHINTFFD